MIRFCLKKLLLLFFITLVFAQKTNSQIPQGYYDGIAGLEGEELRLTLHNIINDHNTRSYNQLWQDFYHTDRKPNGKVWCMYTDIPYPGEPVFEFTFFDDQQGTGGASEEGLVYNREHSFPTSWWGGGTSAADTMYTDLFHIHPVDAWINTLRSNWPFGEVCEPNHVTSNGSKRGSNCYDFEGAYTGTAFEPIDAYKGDFARNYFYMLTRYMHRVESWNEYNNTDMLEGDGFAPWAYDMLLSWHIMDPVSPKEVDRNNAVYELQGNRNPFIDHPELVCLIWGGDCTFAPSVFYTRTIPEYPEAFDYVNIEAFIYDDGEVVEATLYWGLEPDNIQNAIEMEYLGENLFRNIDSIPPQENLAEIYYQIEATDDDYNTSKSTKYTYLVGKPIGGGLENFDRLDAPGSQYVDGEFVGNNDIKWYYYHSRNQLSYEIDGRGLMFRDPNESRIISEPIPHGIQDFSVKLRKAFTNDQPRQAELFINSEKIAESNIFGTFWGECDSIHKIEVSKLDIKGDVVIEIRLNNPESDEYNQIVIDDIFWTEYAPRIIIQKDKLGCFPGTPINEYSEIEYYYVVGRFLDENLYVEANSPFEVSKDGENFFHSVSFENNNEFEMHKVYVRFKPTEELFYEDEIIHHSGDVINTLNICGYGGSVSIGDINDFIINKPKAFYKNNRIKIVWEKLPETPYQVKLFQINGAKITSRVMQPELRTSIPVNTQSGVVILLISTNKDIFTEKIVIL